MSLCGRYSRLMTRPLDTSPLTVPVSKAEVAQFRAANRTRPAYASANPIGAVIVAVFAFVFLATVGISFLGIAWAAIGGSLSDGVTPVGLVFLAFPLFFVVVVVLVAVTVLRRGFGRGDRWERYLRLDRFAAANGLEFSPMDADPQYPGSIFGQGRSRVVLDHLRSAQGRFLDYGTYRYVTGSGKNSTTHTWGFLALALDRALPHMVLDATANDGLFGSTLPAMFNCDQVLGLEGDFGRHFTLYCPKEYERDALYVFTPDLMALLIDEAAAFDVEIVDRWMFVYSTSAFELGQPAMHERLHRIVDTVGAQTVDNTDRYRDERVATFAQNAVAPDGRRLRRGISVGAIVLIIIFGAVWLGPFIADLVFGFFR